MSKRSYKESPDCENPAKKVRGEHNALNGFPSAQNYEFSYMHRDVVTHVAVARAAEFVLTASADGHVKFWRKMPRSIEFVKQFVAHLDRLVSLTLSHDDQRLLTSSVDSSVKIFDVVQFDMSGMLDDLAFVPSYAAWLSLMRIVVADSSSSILRVFDVNNGNACLLGCE